MSAVPLSGCVIVNGMPGAGKSTVSTLAARLLPRAARVKGDDVNEMIISGRVWFAGDPPEEAARQVELCHRNMCSLAANFVDFGFTVLMDTVVVDRAELDFLVGLLAPRPVRLVTLAPGSEVCRQRNASRQSTERWEFAGYDRLEADMRQGFGNVGWWFDTSALDATETAERVVQDAARFDPLT
jgi:predicted kinase